MLSLVVLHNVQAENSGEPMMPLLQYPIGLGVEKKAEQLGTGVSWLGCRLLTS